jgi:hypothetical protein
MLPSFLDKIRPRRDAENIFGEYNLAGMHGKKKMFLVSLCGITLAGNEGA